MFVLNNKFPLLNPESGVKWFWPSSITSNALSYGACGMYDFIDLAGFFHFMLRIFCTFSTWSSVFLFRLWSLDFL